jgi:hypothetical protein
VSAEQRVPADHPLRAIRALLKMALFAAMASATVATAIANRVFPLSRLWKREGCRSVV